ncbi:MAG: amidohydrolase [Eubacteriales bacterium]|nr:amidohydrolase [Eubacteriales bacterium]MDY3332910.1 amidohydrolase [Gallibacter sp.]
MKKILFRNFTYIDKNNCIEYSKDILVEGNTIKSIKDSNINKIEELIADDFDDVIDGKGKVLLPGFVNAHTHLPMTLLRGYSENLKLNEWLFDKVFPFEDQLNEKNVYWASKLAIAEALRFGITSISDMYFFTTSIADAVIDSKFRANLSRSISHFDDTDFMTSNRASEMIELYERYGGLKDDRLKIDASIHAEYTITKNAAVSVCEFAKKHNMRMQVHLSETKKENDDCYKRHSMSPTKFLKECGAFDIPATAAHCVWIDDDDLMILKEKNVTVVTNPISNLKLLSGICDVKRYLDSGINVALGTDGTASNNSFNFIEEMKTLALTANFKADDPAALKPIKILDIATKNGYIAQGRENLGYISEGMKADLIVVNTDKPNMQPVHNLLNNIVYSSDGSDVYLTMVDGNILYKNGEYTTIDIDKTIFEVDKYTRKILEKI